MVEALATSKVYEQPNATKYVGNVLSARARKLAASLSAATLALGIGAAIAPKAAEAKIVPGQGIAGVKLGDTPNQVKRAVGHPYTDTKHDGMESYSYAVINGKIPLVTEVGFTSAGKVAGISTENPKQRTSKGIGMGSVESAVKRAYPAVECQGVEFGSVHMTYCQLDTRVGGEPAVTTFELSTQHPDFEHFANSSIQRVDAVDVSIPAAAPNLNAF